MPANGNGGWVGRRRGRRGGLPSRPTQPKFVGAQHCLLSPTMRVCLMIEGQEGVTWDQWRALATTAEEAGFEALFRSDHYMPLGGGEGGSLDAWATINALAAITSTIRLGTLVSPASFRHPSTLAREVVTADHVSNGRVELGLGAGWHEGEHKAHGFPFDSLKERFDRMAEQFEIVHRSFTEGPFDFEGRFYRLENATRSPSRSRTRTRG